MSDFFPLSIEADRVRPITPEYGLLRGECWTTVPLPPPAGLFVPLRPKPTDIPIEQATKFEFILNVKAAKALSLNISYCLHNGLNRNSWPIIGGYFPRPRCDSLAPSDSGKTDGQMQQSRGAAAENCVALEDTGGAAPTHPDGVVEMLNIHDLKAAYEKAIGHATSDSTVYNLLHRHGWRKLMPRPFHPKRDLAAQNTFKKTAFLML